MKTRIVWAHILMWLVISNMVMQVPAQVSSAPLTVKAMDYGVTPNDGTNDTVAVRNAINAVNNNPDGGTVVFPSGTLYVSNMPLTANARGVTGPGAALLDRDIANVELRGEGTATVLKRVANVYRPRLMTIHGATNLTIRNMTFDTNGQLQYGGNGVYSVRNLRIEHTTAFDSAVQPITSSNVDRYAWVFGVGTATSEGVIFKNNLVRDLEVEIDNMRHVEITDNTFERGDFTSALGSFAQMEQQIFEDVQIRRNWFINPARQGLTLQLDTRPGNLPATNSVFKDIYIAENTWIYNGSIRSAPNAIWRLGANDNRVANPGVIFDNIRFERNHIYIAPDTPGTHPPFIFANTSGATGFKFTNLHILNNTFFFNGTGQLIDVRRVAGDSVTVQNNTQVPWREPGTDQTVP